MKNNNVDKFFEKYAMTETLNVLKEIKEKRNQEMKDARMKFLSSIVYKVPLYSFNSVMPNYLVDNEFEKVFNFDRCIFVTVVDKNHVKEIKTGMVFSILNLSKENDNFESSYIDYTLSDEQYSRFALSKNSMLQGQKSTLEELISYIKCDEKVIRDYINGQCFSSNKKVKSI